jgi:TPR repeat protein
MLPRLTRTATIFIAALALFLSAPAHAQAADAPKAAGKDAGADAKKEELDPEKLRQEAFARGKRAYDRGDWLKAIFDLRPLAEWGDARAMILLGNMYASGNGVNKDAKEAFQLYHRAAVNVKDETLGASLDGMIAIAAMYQTGLGVGVNTRLAIGWFERAARLGSQGGAFFYGIHAFQGSKGSTYDFKSDHAEAYKWFRLAATKGPDKKLRRAAYKTSETLAARLPPDKVIEMNKAASDWAPDTLAVIGPNPEEILIKEMQAKGQDINPGQMPVEKPLVNPAPRKQEDDGESLVPP